MVTSSNMINFVFPISLFNNKQIFIKNKCFILKYNFNINRVSFPRFSKYIINNYYTILKISKCVKKSSVKSRRDLNISTRKP